MATVVRRGARQVHRDSRQWQTSLRARDGGVWGPCEDEHEDIQYLYLGDWAYASISMTLWSLYERVWALLCAWVYSSVVSNPPRRTCLTHSHARTSAGREAGVGGESCADRALMHASSVDTRLLSHQVCRHACCGPCRNWRSVKRSCWCLLSWSREMGSVMSQCRKFSFRGENGSNLHTNCYWTWITSSQGLVLSWLLLCVMQPPLPEKPKFPSTAFFRLSHFIA